MVPRPTADDSTIPAPAPGRPAATVLRRMVRRLTRFSLGTLLLLVVAVAGLLAVRQGIVAPYHRQTAALEALAKRGATIASEPASPAWLASIVGREHFRRVTSVAWHDPGTRTSDAPGPTDAALALLPRLMGLNEVRLEGGDFTEAGLAALAACPDLERLEVSDWGREGPPTGDGAARQLAACRSLRALEIGSTSITDEGLVALAPLPRLEYLDLPRTVTGPGLAAVLGSPTLTELDLSRTRVLDRHLVGLPAPRSLTAIRLPATVSDAGVAAVASWERVAVLDLSDCRDVSSEALAATGRPGREVLLFDDDESSGNDPFGSVFDHPGRVELATRQPVVNTSRLEAADLDLVWTQTDRVHLVLKGPVRHLRLDRWLAEGVAAGHRPPALVIEDGNLGAADIETLRGLAPGVSIQAYQESVQSYASYRVADPFSGVATVPQELSAWRSDWPDLPAPPEDHTTNDRFLTGVVGRGRAVEAKDIADHVIEAPIVVIDDAHLTTGAVRALARRPGVRGLVLQDVTLDAADWPELAAATDLERVALLGVRLTSRAFEPYTIRPLRDDDLSVLEAMPKLTHLAIGGDLTDTAAERIAALPRLTWLDLRSLALTGRGDRTLETSDRLTSIQLSTLLPTGPLSSEGGNPCVRRRAAATVRRLAKDSVDVDFDGEWLSSCGWVVPDGTIDGPHYVCDGATIERLLAAESSKVELVGVSLSRPAVAALVGCPTLRRLSLGHVTLEPNATEGLDGGRLTALACAGSGALGLAADLSKVWSVENLYVESDLNDTQDLARCLFGPDLRSLHVRGSFHGPHDPSPLNCLASAPNLNDLWLMSYGLWESDYQCLSGRSVPIRFFGGAERQDTPAAGAAQQQYDQWRAGFATPCRLMPVNPPVPTAGRG